MAYQVPQRPHIASRWLTATLIGIYVAIIALVLLLSTDSNGSINSDSRSSGFSNSTKAKSAAAKPATAYRN